MSVPGEVGELNERVVVTAAGLICSTGAGLGGFREALESGRTGFAPSGVINLGEEEPPVVAEVTDFEPKEWLGAKGLRALDRSARLLAVAAHMALSDAGRLASDESEGDPSLGLICGTMFGSVHSIASFDWSGLEDGPKFVNPMAFPNTVINSPAGQAAIKFKLRGINSTISAGLASSLFAIQYAADFLRFGRASMLLAGGVEEVCEESYLGFRKNGWLSRGNRALPFSEGRDGVVLGEGSALLAMETASSAGQRGARVLAEFGAFGWSHDAHSISRYAQTCEGPARSINQALGSAGIAPEQVGAIVSGASGSQAGDRLELDALRQVFGPALSRIPVCCPKAACGEALGVSGALGVAVGLLILERGQVPPTPGCSGVPTDLSVSLDSQPFDGDWVLITGFSCDGNNAALLLKRAC